MSEAPTVDQAPPTPVEVPTDSRQDAGQGKKVEAPRVRIRTKIRVRARPQTPLFLSPSKLLIQELLRHKLRTLVLVVYLFSLFTAFVYIFFFFFVKEMYFTLIINENMPLLLYKS